MNTGLKTFKIEQKFGSIDELYGFLIENVNFIEEKARIKIGKEGLKEQPYCVTGFEAVTERKILFYDSPNTMPENIGELIVLAGAFQADIIVFIVEKINPTILEPMNWLKNALNSDTEVILAEAKIV